MEHSFLHSFFFLSLRYPDAHMGRTYEDKCRQYQTRRERVLGTMADFISPGRDIIGADYVTLQPDWMYQDFASIIKTIEGNLAGAEKEIREATTAFYYNPAGLARIKGENIGGGTQFAFIRLKYRNSEGYSQPGRMVAPMPFFGYSTDKAKPVVLGVGLFSRLGTVTQFL